MRERWWFKEMKKKILVLIYLFVLRFSSWFCTKNSLVPDVNVERIRALFSTKEKKKEEEKKTYFVNAEALTHKINSHMKWVSRNFLLRIVKFRGNSKMLTQHVYDWVTISTLRTFTMRYLRHPTHSRSHTITTYHPDITTAKTAQHSQILLKIFFFFLFLILDKKILVFVIIVIIIAHQWFYDVNSATLLFYLH